MVVNHSVVFLGKTTSTDGVLYLVVVILFSLFVLFLIFVL